MFLTSQKDPSYVAKDVSSDGSQLKPIWQASGGRAEELVVRSSVVSCIYGTAWLFSTFAKQMTIIAGQTVAVIAITVTAVIINN